ncbi:MAG TPA: leucyl aminopeptidase family protein [Stellaceae bacterium]|jgi:leucyl aminopeptidase|nr:leucyl aminopeptidase family protein [Stellaceae bacterium]
MAFSLIDSARGATPVTALTTERLAGWLREASERERNWAQSTGFAADAGKHSLVPGEDGRLGRVLVGLGDGPKAGSSMWSLAALPDALPEGSYRLDPAPGGADPTRLALGWALATYAFTRYHAKPATSAALVWPEGVDRGEVERLARAAFLARDLANTPAGDLGPEELAHAAVGVAEAAGACHRVVVGDKLLAENYPTIHAVGRASTRPPRLVDIVWGDPAAPKVTLVGKGVCFDTGGLDLKPAAGMRLMKKDMAGAAIVLGLAQAIMDARLPVRLRVLLPCVENSVSGNAMRPLDVVRTRKGLTVEIGNTDAEGRLILCDALAEASTETPALLVDMATLTGAARVALGPELAALFCNDDALAGALLDAAGSEEDPMWRMPLWRPYRKMIDSKIADLNNVSEGPHAGAITAALYLQEFVEPGIPWAHLDVMAWNPQGRPGRPEGAEATALRALYAHISGRFG